MTKSAPRWAATRSASCARASCRWRQASAPRNDTNLKTRSPRARMERRAGMIRLDGHDRITDPLRGGVIALGNFDGFHAGHQAVVGRAVHHAKDDGRPCIVATFDPHPVRFFKPDTPSFRLTTLDHRQELFGPAGPGETGIAPGRGRGC